MPLTMRDNAAQVERDLDRLAERIAAGQIRVVNTLMKQAERAGFAEINTVYQIKPSAMSQYASVQLAAANDPQAVLTVKGRGFPLSLFNPRQGPKGVTVTIKGHDVLFPHAFMTPKFGRNVFARGAYGGKGVSRPTGESFGRFAFSTPRLPINKFWTFAPPDCLDNEQVRRAMDDTVAANAPKQLQRELSAAARGFG